MRHPMARCRARKIADARRPDDLVRTCSSTELLCGRSSQRQSPLAHFLTVWNTINTVFWESHCEPTFKTRRSRRSWRACESDTPA